MMPTDPPEPPGPLVSRDSPFLLPSLFAVILGVVALDIWLWPQAVLAWQENFAGLAILEIFDSASSITLGIMLLAEIIGATAFGYILLAQSSTAVDAKWISYIIIAIGTIIGEILAAFLATALTLIGGLFIILGSLLIIYGTMLATWPNYLAHLRYVVCQILVPWIVPKFEMVLNLYVECVEWGERAFSVCAQFALNQFEVCTRWWRQLTRQCQQWARRQRRVCTAWGLVPCTGNRLQRLACRVGTWIAERACLAFTWVVQAVCVVWEVVATIICIAWWIVLLLVCTLFVIIVWIVCLAFLVVAELFFALIGLVILILRLLVWC